MWALIGMLSSLSLSLVAGSAEAQDMGEPCAMSRMRREGDTCVWCAGPDFRGCHPQPEIPGSRSCIGNEDGRELMILCTPEGGAAASPETGCACRAVGGGSGTGAPLALLVVGLALAALTRGSATHRAQRTIAAWRKRRASIS